MTREQPQSHSASAERHASLVHHIRQTGFCLHLGAAELFLAREFGFCYGVERAVSIARRTREHFPEKRIFLTAEIIHNPRVNRELREAGVRFLAGPLKGDIGVEDLGPGDVVLLPAFGARVDEIARLRTRGCTLVNTTCGSVVCVWKRVERYAREGFTAVIHGKFRHEETIATCSRVTQVHGGKYAVVRDKSEAQLLCSFITGQISSETLLERLGRAMSDDLNPVTDLQRIGLANQTTMLSGHSMEIAAMLREAIQTRYGADSLPAHFRSFETICSATQDRQDAVRQLSELQLDLLLVIGGFNSSNTSHLAEIGSRRCRTLHIEDASDLVSPLEARYKPCGAKNPGIAADWLPALPCRIGITAGASTPDHVTGEVIARIAELCGCPIAGHPKV